MKNDDIDVSERIDRFVVIFPELDPYYLDRRLHLFKPFWNNRHGIESNFDIIQEIEQLFIYYLHFQ